MAVSADAMEAQEQIQAAMGDMINEIDKSHLRKIQLRMHQCAAKCCSDEKASLEDTHSCIEVCSRGVHTAQNYVQKEVGGFQERLQRCVLDCQDKTKDKMGATPTEPEVDSLKLEFEQCAIRCVNDHLKLLPNLVKRMKAALAKQS
ncbi:protein FAM136A [Folsomia candida]|uniref:Protein FAM136A n=1 Tax=Folsomia candida TaxID=158441 RepID=A0A226EG25_FOLCA|nr:protein FAM136A [Folsomia candida]OXA56369.1 hypothetical protein Fcan01_09431 [Folsomia candida]